MRRVLAVAIAVLALIAGFFGGAWWHAELAREPPTGPKVAPIALPPTPPLPVEPLRTPNATTVQMPSPAAAEREACPQTTAALDASTRALTAAQAELHRADERRVAREGSPLSPPTGPTEPRFAPEALRSAVSDAFTQTRVPGRVDGLDCSEWPCIIYGRIRGTEDEMEKLEGAKALANYERDILTVLLWVVTDEAANAAPIPGLPGRPEQSLFAFALYPRGLERALADNIDRRVRSRTAELWNTMSPSDQTGR